MRLLKAEEMRRCDAHAIDVLGIPGAVLMENAGRAVHERGLALLRDRGGRRAVIFCGGGNNGGDGFVVARLLHGAGVDVHLVLARDPSGLTGDAAVNWQEVERLKLSHQIADGGGEPMPDLGDGDLVVDALLGTGLTRDVGGIYATLVDEMARAREAGAVILAVDVPSGLNADTGQIMGCCVTADATVTFGYLKRGLVLHPGARLAGEVRVADIGLPPEVETILEAPAAFRLTDEIVRALLPAYPPDAHKGTFGHVLVVAGSRERPGAAALVCHGALRAGAGLVTLATRAGGDASTRPRLPEAMGITLSGDGPLGLGDRPALMEAAAGKDAVVIGPGIPRGEETGALISALLRELRVPMILDADGLNALAGDLSALAAAATEVILTPHPKEMARLLGRDVAFVQADRMGVAETFARDHRVHLVLKGAGTVIADPTGEMAVCTAGSPALATGGTGDVLAGMLAALCAGGLDACAAARVAVQAHALAGDVARARWGRAGTLASDVADALGEVWRGWGY